MRHLSPLLATSMLAASPMPAAFMAKAPTTPPVTPEAPNASTTSPRVAPELTSIRTDIPMPVRATARGSQSTYDFEQLTAVGMSFGVKNKTQKQMVGIITTANRKYQVDKTDTNGAIVYKQNPVKDANGTVVGTTNGKAERVFTRHFFAVDVDAKTDPDGASVRIFRDK